MDPILEELIQKLPSFFVPQKAKGVNITAQLNLKEEEIDVWTLTVADQHCEVKHQRADRPNVTLTTTSTDLLAILSGKMNVTRAYMTGKIKLEGKITQALRLIDLFDIPDELRTKINL